MLVQWLIWNKKLQIWDNQAQQFLLPESTLISNRNTYCLILPSSRGISLWTQSQRQIFSKINPVHQRKKWATKVPWFTLFRTCLKNSQKGKSLCSLWGVLILKFTMSRCMISSLTLTSSETLCKFVKIRKSKSYLWKESKKLLLRAMRTAWRY